MTREDIYQLAKQSIKEDYRVYSKLKMMLDEKLSSTAYAGFLIKLAKILNL